MKKLILLTSNIEKTLWKIPLAAGQLKSALDQVYKSELETLLYTITSDMDIKTVIRHLHSETPDYLGLSLYLWNRTQLLDIAKEIKQQLPNLVIIAGGAEATADQANLSRLAEIDHVISGEGESELIRYFSFLDHQSFNTPHSSDFLPNLKTLPSPYLSKTLELSKTGEVLWELSRGCPFNCAFCFESRGNHQVRYFDMGRIETELELFEEHEIEQIFVLDPTFNFDRERAKDLLHLFAEKAPQILYLLEIRAEFVDKEMAALFAAINCSLQIGLQSSNPEVLKNINRKMNPQVFRDKILLLHQAGAVYGFDLIYGLPGDCISSFRESVNFAMEMVPNQLEIFPLAVLPGTELRETAEKFNLKYDYENPYLIRETPEFGPADLNTAAAIALGCSLLYNKGKAVPWFNTLCAAARISADKIFEDFGNWIRYDQNLTEDTAEDLLDKLIPAFISKIMDSDNSAKVLTDIIRYFSHYNHITQTCFNYPEKIDTCAINPTGRFQHFTFNPEDLISMADQGINDLEILIQNAEKCDCRFFLYMWEGQVVCCRLSEEEEKCVENPFPGEVFDNLVNEGILLIP